MKIKIIEAKSFKKDIDSFIAKKKILIEDFEDFKRQLAENPTIGDLISGTGGLRKVRLKSSSGGKSGGFRICYYKYDAKLSLFLLLIYQKNEQENITDQDKKKFKEIIAKIKGGKK